jgi:subtilisin family serine protease
MKKWSTGGLAASRAKAKAGMGMELSRTKPRAPHVDHLASQLYTAAKVKGASPARDGVAELEPNGSIEVTVTGPGALAASRSAQAEIVAIVPGAVTIATEPSTLRRIASATGVSLVAPIQKAFELGASSQGVVASGAQSWITAGASSDGTGVKVGIVDAGFANLSTEVAAGDLPAGLTVVGDHCTDVNNSAHGTAVAEIVHQMAPEATLYLYCVDDNVGFAQAGQDLTLAGVSVVNSSLGFAADSRGDGSGIENDDFISSVLTVKRARQAGVLWVQAAGNNAADHWSGTFADANNDGFSDLNTASDFLDGEILPPGGTGFLALTWDQWPTSTLPMDLVIEEYDSQGNFVATSYGTANPASPTEPVRWLSIRNNGVDDHVYWIGVQFGGAKPAIHYDLSYFGDLSGSYFATAVDTAHTARAAFGSIADPASSPYALAAGASFWSNSRLELFSSRGPTIDGRVKPDLLGFDGTASNLYPADPDTGDPGGFFGTSAAAPHVAGAAALIKSRNPAMDASQIQALLEKRTTQNTNPPNNSAGHGILSMGGLTDVAAPAGSGYNTLSTPIRILDTRTTTGNHHAILTSGTEVQVIPAGIPSDATAVVVNVTGVGATGGTYLSVYPTSFPGTSNLNLSASDSTAAVAATVALNAQRGFKVRNTGMGKTNLVIDVVGYFAPAGAGYQALATPTRVLDTRTTNGAHHYKVVGNETVTIPFDSGQAGVPAGATAVAANVTVANMVADGYLAVFPATFTGTSTLNYLRNVRANLAVVGLSGGAFRIINKGAPVDLVVDVVGYFGPSATSKFRVLPSPVRIADTRSGNGGRYGQLPAGGTLTLDEGGLNGLPYGASSVWAGVTAVPTAPGFLTAYPAGQTRPTASTVNFTAGRVVSNAAVVGLQTGDLKVDEQTSPTHAVVDLFGYFSD